MNIIKLHPDQDGSVWYLPEGLPGVLAIRNGHTTVFLIKRIYGSDEIPGQYYLNNRLYFADEPLYCRWSYSISEYPGIMGFYVPRGYRCNFIRDYEIVPKNTLINDYIKEQFECLYKIYRANRTMFDQIKELFNHISRAFWNKG